MFESLTSLTGGGGLQGASSGSSGRASFGSKGGGITFGNKGIDQRYVIAGVALLVLGYVVVSLKG